MSLYWFIALAVIVSAIHSWGLFVFVYNDRKAHQGKMSVCGRVVVCAVTFSMVVLLTLIYLQSVEIEAISHESLWEMLENADKAPLVEKYIELQLSK